MFEITVRHDTTMWNEGFEYAREPLVTAVVASQADADAIASKVSAISDANDQAREWGMLFNVKVELARPGSVAVPSASAEKKVLDAIDAWDGI